MVREAIQNTFNQRQLLSTALHTNTSYARGLRSDLLHKARAFSETGNSDMALFLTNIAEDVVIQAESLEAAYERYGNAESQQTGAEIGSILVTLLNPRE